MKTYVTDIIPRIRNFSQRLDNKSALTEKHWIIVDDEGDEETVYVFRRKKNELLISRNGRLKKCRWELIGEGSLLIDHGEESFLFKHGFMDNAVLALNRQGTDEYAILVNESELPRIGYELRAVTNYLESAYNTEILGSFVGQHGTEAAREGDTESGEPDPGGVADGLIGITLILLAIFAIALTIIVHS